MAKEYIEQRDGNYYVIGTRISLDSIVYAFRRGVQNVSVSYVAGYLVSGEAQTVPAASPYQLACASLAQLWANDSGVAYEGGAALLSIA